MLQAFSLPQISAPVPADLSLPGSKKAPGRVPSFGLYHRLPQDSPSRIRAAERHSATILYSLVPPRPSRPASRERQRTAPCRGGGSVPRQQCGTAKRPFPRTVSPAGHRLILNPCRRAAHQNSSLFSILSPSPGLLLPLPGKAREPPFAGVDICSFICNNSYTT